VLTDVLKVLVNGLNYLKEPVGLVPKDGMKDLKKVLITLKPVLKEKNQNLNVKNGAILKIVN